MNFTNITICYFGIYKPLQGRNRIYLKGLHQNGARIIECNDAKPGKLKFFRLFWRHWKIRNEYDVLVVGYPGHVMVPFARLISHKPIIFDALCTMYEGTVISRGQFTRWSLKGIYIRLIDRVAVGCAHVILVESEKQRDYFEVKFGDSPKYTVLYTGADDDLFYPSPTVKKRDKFTVIFRGRFLPEAGIRYVTEAARLLEDRDVHFVIIGREEVDDQKLVIQSGNVEHISRFVPDRELREIMLSCHVSLGQFGSHKRLRRTIPHKAYETLALALPYVTARADGISEILTDGENCLMILPANPQDLADKILFLKNNPEARELIGENGYKLYMEKFTPQVLAHAFISLATNLVQTENLQK